MTKLKEEEEEEEEVKEKKPFDLVLVDIRNTWENRSELEEQLLKTPDYTAHITSFDLGTLINLCYFIKQEPDIKEIPYLWADAILVDQHNHSRKKETILKMNQIYKNASYILAVPDLHYEYLMNNSANEEMMKLIEKYRDIIHEDIFNHTKHSTSTNFRDDIKNLISDSTQYNDNHHQHSLKYMKVKKENEELRKENEELRNEIEELKMRMKEEEFKKVYKFLAYLISDWSKRAWVVSEYQIAKEKYIQYGTPLKYIFLSLLSNNKDGLLISKPFFSYTFIDQHNGKTSSTSNIIIDYKKVDSGSRFIHFLESVFIQRSYLDMLLKSNASRNEDRFHAVLPSWNKYQYLIKDKNTISNWNITDMQSVKLKLYEIIYDDGDLCDKIKLLYYCSIIIGKPILPSFATYNTTYLTLTEVDDVDYAHGLILDYLSKCKNDKEYINDYHKKKFKSIFKQNLIDIQYNQQQRYLSVKANKYFIFNRPLTPILNQEELSSYSLKDNNDELKLIYVPFFTIDIPEFIHIFPFNKYLRPLLSGTLLIGNMDINRWILYELWGCHTYGKPSLYSTNGYVFNIY